MRATEVFQGRLGNLAGDHKTMTQHLKEDECVLQEVLASDADEVLKIAKRTYLRLEGRDAEWKEKPNLAPYEPLVNFRKSKSRQSGTPEPSTRPLAYQPQCKAGWHRANQSKTTHWLATRAR